MTTYPSNNLPEEDLLTDIKIITKQYFKDIMKKIESVEARFAWYEKKIRENDSQAAALEDALDRAYEENNKIIDELKVAEMEIEKLQMMLGFSSDDD